MKKADIIRGFKAELKSLQEAKVVSNIDYHRGKMDQLKSLIFDFNHPVEIEKFNGMIKRFPSGELKVVK